MTLKRNINLVGFEHAIPASKLLRSNGISQIILVPQARKSYGRLFQTLQTVKESKLFIEFPFIWPSHLKFIECRK